MMLLSCSILLLCLSATAEDIVVWRESGENVTLECSLAKCPSSIDGFVGMYLYHDLKKCAEVLYYHSSPKYDKITPRIGYLERVEMKGSLKKNTVTISNLTVGDSGIYRCVYRGNVATQLKCNVYNLFVLGVQPCPRSEEELRDNVSETSPPLVLIIVASCAISIIATVIVILLIFRVKQWTGGRRSARTAPNDCVYEVMTKNGFNRVAAPEVQLPDVYGFARPIEK
ncbi:uncharacterized protein LOC118312356 [Scophthalmus maximus]|uniref:uncharacterized protein LOC118312356 n=1 Tax=Scophthalmus maximus TaxID=52904 RepID=UPI001FA8A3AF|nr:uncharacterized protein LOC118312356 [Scophthalmus maximus]